MSRKTVCSCLRQHHLTIHLDANPHVTLKIVYTCSRNPHLGRGGTSNRMHSVPGSVKRRIGAQGRRNQKQNSTIGPAKPDPMAAQGTTDTYHVAARLITDGRAWGWHILALCRTHNQCHKYHDWIWPVNVPTVAHDRPPWSSG